MAPAATIALSSGRRVGPALGMLTDRRLARLASKGDPAAFAAIYERHHQDLFRYCRSITGNGDDAGDALQSTMAAALRALRGDQRDIALRPWLFRIAHNESVSLVRRRASTYELTEASTPSTPGPHAAVVMRERIATLVTDLQTLPERQRGALVMRELNGLDYGEIAGALRISGGAARQAVYEARVALTALDDGRDMECDSVRRSLSGRDGRVLRGRRVRAHIRGCGACTDFGDALGRRRALLPSLLPPLPAAAGVAMLGGLLGGGAAVGGGASIGAAAGAGSSGLISFVTSSLSQAAGASATAKGAATAAAVAVVAGVGTVEVAHELDRPDPVPRASASESGAKPGRAARPGAALAPRVPAARLRGAPRPVPRTVALPPAPPAPVGRRAPGRRPVPAPRVPRVPVAIPVSAPAPTPRVPSAPAPVPQPVRAPAALPAQSWPQQYTDAMRRAQASAQFGAQIYDQAMRGVQDLMSNLFPSAQRR